MLYHMHELRHAATAPMRLVAEAMQSVYSHPWMPLSYTQVGRTMAAGFELLERTTRHYAKPEFNLPNTVVDGQRVAVTERVANRLPFCDLLHFDRALPAEVKAKHPRILVVAPMSGHYATLLRGTVESLLPDHEVYITDWLDARDIHPARGRFGLDEYIDYVIHFLRTLGPNTHVLAVCQPSVPVMAAAALMAEDDDECQPASMTLMGGPIDTRISPTAVNKFATEHSIESFESRVIMTVPWHYEGRGRRVYPGFLQLTGFMSMNMDRHIDAHVKLFEDLIKGDGDSAEQHRAFYDEYLSVMDLPGEFYIETIRNVFQEHALPQGKLTWGGWHVDPKAIRKTALMTIEGEKDDITGLGQTQAAHALCPNIPDHMRLHHVQPKVGHYGVFNGRRYREEILPRMRDFIRNNDHVLGPKRN